MMDGAFAGRLVLVADDEPLTAMDLAEEPEAAGAVVIGPSVTIEQALALIAREPVDAAILDVRLGGELAFPVADFLAEKSVPFILVTGYGADAIPARHADMTICETPVTGGTVVGALERCCH